MVVPEYITIKDKAGSVLAHLSPSADGLADCWIDNELNGQCKLSFRLPLTSEKWQYVTPSNRIYVGGREFALCQADAVQYEKEGKRRWGKVEAHESWMLLSRAFRTISNDPQLTAPPDLTVAIVSGGSNLSGGLYTVGSAAHALYALLQGTGWGLGTVDVTGTYDLEVEKESVLSCVQRVQELWGGWLLWDSVSHTVSLRPDSWQQASGFEVRYGKNQKSIQRTVDHEIVTKLWPFGEKDLDIFSLNTLHSGTAQGGGSNTITLAASANQVSGSYVRGVIALTGGTGAGQTRTIVAYDGATRVATVDANWTTQPDATTTYSINARFLLDFTYTSDLREGVWKNEEIGDATQLKAKAQEMLALVRQPRYNYKVDIADLRVLAGWSQEDFSIGDMIRLVDEELAIDASLRVIGHRYNVFQPWRCEIELGTPLRQIEDAIASLVSSASSVTAHPSQDGGNIHGLPAYVQLKNDGLHCYDALSVDRAHFGSWNDGQQRYGMKVVASDGQTVLVDDRGLLQTWQEGNADNVDGTHPLVLNVYIPAQTRSVKRALLRFRIQNFRAYETGAASGGGATSSAAGTHNHKLFHNTGSSAGGYSLKKHVFRDSDGDTWYIDLATETSSTHIYTYEAAADHAHTVPAHTHNLVFGIYEGTAAAGVTVKINGVDRTSALGGPFNSDQASLDITSYLQINQWNTIELGSTQLGRIDADVFIQALMGV